MSTPRPRFPWIFLAFFVCSQAAISASAQRFEAEIEIDAIRSIASVKGKFLPGADLTRPNLSFNASIAGHGEIGKRIRVVEIFDGRGGRIPYRKLIDGEYLADGRIASWGYEVDLTPFKDMNASAHTSWLSGGRGLLMLADILPISATSGSLTIRVPAGWGVFSAEPAEAGNVFNVTDSSRAVFAIGGEWQQVPVSDTKFKILISGKWNFAQAEAAAMAREICMELKGVFGGDGGEQSQIVLSNFPAASTPGSWQAETRGRNLTIISSDMPFRTQSLQRLHEQLRHEMFHLWIPNGVNLTGDYDWFYEGFALYGSLKLAVKLNRIRFDDFLDTLSRAHTIDSAVSKRISLIQMSANRFSGANTQVYARVMLVAFLCDLALLDQSKGKRSVEYVLRELFEKHQKPAPPSDGNKAVLALLKSNPNVVLIVEKYVEGTDKLEWASELGGAGIEDGDPGLLTHLRVKEKLNGRQKVLLDKLGYNNWRKLSSTSK